MNVKLKDVADIKFCLTGNQKEKSEMQIKWLTSPNLTEDNTVDGFTEDDRYVADESVRISKGDIVIKRISPSYVNYIDSIDDDIYAGNNLILIKQRDNVDSKYLAYILNDNIKKIADASIGATIPAIGRAELEGLNIPLLPLDKQVSLGALWYSNIELKKLRRRLTELEVIKTKYIIDNYLRNNIGGKENGK